MPPRRALICIGLLLALYALLAGRGISRLSATADEPLHAIGAWQAWHRADYRIDREDPPLWLHFVGMFLAEEDVATAYTPDDWARSKFGTDDQLGYLRRAVFLQPGPLGPEGLVKKARRPMLLFALALGASIAYVAWRLGGPRAGVFAAAAFALEPLLLGHGILVKNDVVAALAFLWAAYFLHRVAGRGHARDLAGLSAALALGVTVKFSGPILVIIVGVALVGRALLGRPWTLLNRPLASRARRGLAAAGLLVALALTTYLAIWTVYGFRFRPSPGPEHFDMVALAQRVDTMRLLAQASTLRPSENPQPSPAEIALLRPDKVARVTLWAASHQLLPESFLAGFLYTYSSAIFRPAFLFGAYSDTGFRLYFPAAWIVKTPLILIGAVAVGLMIAARNDRWRRYWFLLLPVGIYGLSAVFGRLNIGLRHLMPAYPFLLVGVGLLAAYAYRKLPLQQARWATVLPLVLLACEVLPRAGHFIPYFNLAAGGPRGGLHLLGDSNLDWGQDLHELVAWQRRNAGAVPYLFYFGPATPRSLGLEYHNVNGSWAPGDPHTPPPGSILAISASHLQGTYLDAALREQMARQRQKTPLAILGDTIYLYRVQ